MLEKIEVDTHTHTVLSGHAWSTLRENAAAGRKAGLRGLCLTEHGHAMSPAIPDFLTLTGVRLLPPELEGLRMFYGVEANIISLDGTLDIAPHMLRVSAWNIASMHSECLAVGDADENTAAYLAALRNPAVDMLGHIDDGRTPNRFDAVVREAAALGKIIEINNNSIPNRSGSVARIEEIARLCARHGARVAVSSDAHFDEMVGRAGPALDLLARGRFPDELVVNRTLESFLSYVEERGRRVSSG